MQYFCIIVQTTLLLTMLYNDNVCFDYIGGMFTANTMSSAVETLGMTLPGHHVI